MSEPSIWIGCLAAYNEGHLHGEWCDATDVDTINATAAEVHATSPALLPEELFIADYDGFGPVGSRLGEYADFETVARIAVLIERHGQPFIAWVDATEPDLDAIDSDTFEQAYCGRWDDERDFARDFVDDCGWAGVPAAPVATNWSLSTVTVVNPIEALAGYLDWPQIARDLFQHGEHTAVPSPDGGIYVFTE